MLLRCFSASMQLPQTISTVHVSQATEITFEFSVGMRPHCQQVHIKQQLCVSACIYS
jgi:hypothetical protein